MIPTVLKLAGEADLYKESIISLAKKIQTDIFPADQGTFTDNDFIDAHCKKIWTDLIIVAIGSF